MKVMTQCVTRILTAFISSVGSAFRAEIKCFRFETQPPDGGTVNEVNIPRTRSPPRELHYSTFGFLNTVSFECEASVGITTSLGFRIKKAIIIFD